MDGTPKHNEDLELPYPDLSKFDVYKKWKKELLVRVVLVEKFIGV
jgi:hypothetical protein